MTPYRLFYFQMMIMMSSAKVRRSILLLTLQTEWKNILTTTSAIHL